MLKVVFHIGPNAYSVDASKIAEIVPLLPVKKTDGSADYFAGLLDYRGVSVPVIDLSLLITGQPAAARFSTRIMILNVQAKKRQELLGLIAERITTMTHNQTAAPPDLETIVPESMYDFLLSSAS